MREHLAWWAVTKEVFPPSSSARNYWAKKFSNCPNFLKHKDIFRMPKLFGQKSKISSTFIRRM
jgi:hypothetical protein